MNAEIGKLAHTLTRHAYSNDYSHCCISGYDWILTNVFNENRKNPFIFHILLPHINIYIKIYQFNKIYGKRVELQVRKLSYSPPPERVSHIVH